MALFQQLEVFARQAPTADWVARIIHSAQLVHIFQRQVAKSLATAWSAPQVRTARLQVLALLLSNVLKDTIVHQVKLRRHPSLTSAKLDTPAAKEQYPHKSVSPAALRI
jgi:hypothetical protein